MCIVVYNGVFISRAAPLENLPRELLSQIVEFLGPYLPLTEVSRSMRAQTRAQICRSHEQRRAMRERMLMYREDNITHRPASLSEDLARQWVTRFVPHYVEQARRAYTAPTPLAEGTFVDVRDYLNTWSIGWVVSSQERPNRQILRRPLGLNLHMSDLILAASSRQQSGLEPASSLDFAAADCVETYTHYLIRFCGWRHHWDEWVPADCVEALGTHTSFALTRRPMGWTMYRTLARPHNMDHWQIVRSTRDGFPTTALLVWFFNSASGERERDRLSLPRVLW